MDFTATPRSAHEAAHADLSSITATIDERTFATVVELHGATVHRYLCARLGPEVAEDAAAETFAIAWKLRARFDPGVASVEPWLLGIATKVIMRSRSAERRWLGMCVDTARTTELSGEGDPAEMVERFDAMERAGGAVRAVAALPRREREPFLLHVLRGLTYEDIAAALDVPIGTVRSRISRARARIVSNMEEPA